MSRPLNRLPEASASDDEDQAALRHAAADDAALCTIVGIDGSFSRRLGAQLAVNPAGVTVGSLSDGCLERELANQVRLAGADRRPVLLRYGQGSPFVDFRLPCGAGLDILVDPAPDRAALRNVVAALDNRDAAKLPLPCNAPGLLHDREYLPELRLLVLGEGPEAEWLHRLGQGYGLHCTSAGPDAGLALGRAPAELEADRWTAIVLLFHDHEWEHSLLAWALATDACYIGSLGGAKARQERGAILRAIGAAPDQIARVRGPIGLIPHTRDARALALSVLSDVVAEYERLRTPNATTSAGRAENTAAPRLYQPYNRAAKSPPP